MAALEPETHRFMFFDDMEINTEDVKRHFPSAECVLIDPTHSQPDLKHREEFRDNIYAQGETSTNINFGFCEEHMAMVDAWLPVENPYLVFDWDKTLSVIEGLGMPQAQAWGKKYIINTYEGNGASIEDAQVFVLGGHARVAMLREFFARVTAEPFHAKIVVVTNNNAACPFVPGELGRNRQEFLRFVRYIIPQFEEKDLVPSSLYSSKGVALEDYFEKGGYFYEPMKEPYYIRRGPGREGLVLVNPPTGGKKNKKIKKTKKRRTLKYGSRRNK